MTIGPYSYVKLVVLMLSLYVRTLIFILPTNFFPFSIWYIYAVFVLTRVTRIHIKKDSPLLFFFYSI